MDSLFNDKQGGWALSSPVGSVQVLHKQVLLKCRPPPCISKISAWSETPPSPYLAYVILERKCRPIVPRTRDCSAGKSIKSSLPQCLVTQLTSNFIIMGLRGQFKCSNGTIKKDLGIYESVVNT